MCETARLRGDTLNDHWQCRIQSNCSTSISGVAPGISNIIPEDVKLNATPMHRGQAVRDANHLKVLTIDTRLERPWSFHSIRVDFEDDCRRGTVAAYASEQVPLVTSCGKQI